MRQLLSSTLASYLDLARTTTALCLSSRFACGRAHRRYRWLLRYWSAVAAYLAKKGAVGVATACVGSKTAAGKAAQATAFRSKAMIIQADILSNNSGEAVIQSTLLGLGTDYLELIVNHGSHRALQGDDIRSSAQVSKATIWHQCLVIYSAFPHLSATTVVSSTVPRLHPVMLMRTLSCLTVRPRLHLIALPDPRYPCRRGEAVDHQPCKHWWHGD
jgi:hypothetical protein